MPMCNFVKKDAYLYNYYTQKQTQRLQKQSGLRKNYMQDLPVKTLLKVQTTSCR